MYEKVFIYVCLIGNCIQLLSLFWWRRTFDIDQLEGTWGLVRLQGYYIEDGEKESWNEGFDPYNPTDDDDCEKVDINKNDDGSYTMLHYEYYSGRWNMLDRESFKLEGKKMIPLSDDADVSAQIVSVSSKQLVVETKYKDEEGEEYEKRTYKKM